MTTRRHILEQPQRGRKDQSVLEFIRGLEGQRRAILALPGDIPGEVVMDILEAIQGAYRAGREDRAAELIPDPGFHFDPLRHLVHAEALDAIAQWGTGYTTPIDELAQHYITLTAEDTANDTLTVAVSAEQRSEVLRTFRVRVLVEETGQGAGQ